MSDAASAKSPQFAAETAAGGRLSVGTREELVNRAEALIPTLPGARRGGRRAPPATVANRARPESVGHRAHLQPARYGGCEAPFAGMVDILRTIARGCGSTSWCLAQYIGHNFIGGAMAAAGAGGGLA